jgi:hypothetical protein
MSKDILAQRSVLQRDPHLDFKYNRYNFLIMILLGC